MQPSSRWVSLKDARVLGCEWWRCEGGRRTDELHYQITENHNRPVLRYPNGDMYLGGWAKCRSGVDKPQGFGVFLSFDLIILVGQWDEGHLEGYARQLWLPQSNIWRNNYDPLSCIKTDNGVGLPFLYFGNFKSSKRNDVRATVVLKDGTTRIGPWKNDLPVGDWWQDHASTRTPVWEIKRLLAFASSDDTRPREPLPSYNDDVDTQAAQDGGTPLIQPTSPTHNNMPPISVVIVPVNTPRSSLRHAVSPMESFSHYKYSGRHSTQIPTSSLRSSPPSHLAICTTPAPPTNTFFRESPIGRGTSPSSRFNSPTALSNRHSIPDASTLSKPPQQNEQISSTVDDRTLQSKQRKGKIGPKRLEVMLRHKLEATFSDAASNMSIHGEDTGPWMIPKEPFQPPTHVLTHESRDTFSTRRDVYFDLDTSVPTLSNIAVDGLGTDYLRDRIAILSSDERDLEFAEIDVQDDALFTISNLDEDESVKEEPAQCCAAPYFGCRPQINNNHQDDESEQMASLSSKINMSPSHIVMGYGGEVFDFTVTPSNHHHNDGEKPFENEGLVELETMSSLKSMTLVTSQKPTSWFGWLGS
ncbi:hypothetical protein FisN_9Hh275 [Fistulifera solaris]|uniref:Uncharacterized protein n=1 Tax=Fistulifera solaris TaxID=1519565 RepID=A0A1Z5JB07_FISSO|nr:hypothetical protein FisN_9Hh275 [Fistulifera solaris]|eukprot:GAX11180.1 hypothetical protein FisN_9Hh275 [Fistulifera solaris]